MVDDKILTPDDIKKIQQAFEDMTKVIEGLIPVIKTATKAIQEFEQVCLEVTKLSNER